MELHISTADRHSDTLVCVGLRRIVTVAFLHHVQIFLLTYLLTYRVASAAEVLIKKMTERSMT